MKTYLTTDRLLLREFAEADAELLIDLDSDPEVMRYIGPLRQDLEYYRNRIRTVFQRYYAQASGLGVWGVVEQASNAFLGWICLRPALDYQYHAAAAFRADDAELGYRLRRAAWGKGYATEMARALVHRGFVDLQVPRVVAAALVTNRASIRVLEKAGLKRTGDFPVSGFEAPAAKYELTREEYLGTQLRMEHG